MPLRLVKVEGRRYEVIDHDDVRHVVVANHHLTTLLLEDPGAWASACSAEQVLDGPGRVTLDHGTNTRSYLSDTGAWIVCGPWPEFVQDLASQASETGGLIATASVADQWRYRPGRRDLAARRLADLICAEIPRWSAMRRARRTQLHGEMRELVFRFFGSATRAELDSDEDTRFEPYPGHAAIPTRLLAGADTAATATAIEATSGVPGTPNFQALDYWWQSIFAMWWKGFW